VSNITNMSHLLSTLNVAHGDSAIAAGFSADGRYAATGGMDGIIVVSELATGREILRLDGPSEVVVCVSWASNCVH
jgi:WD40 repeat protein